MFICKDKVNRKNIYGKKYYKQMKEIKITISLS